MNFKLDRNTIGARMLRKPLFLAVLLIAQVGVTSAVAQEAFGQKELENKIERLDSKRGLEIGLDVKSEFLSSRMDADYFSDADSTVNKENVGYTQLDINFLFRPWENTSVNVTTRLSSDYQVFFNSAAKVLEVPWMSIDGRIGNPPFLTYSVGDFKEKYSPLTVFSPELDFMYEPEIFARQRYMAMDQLYLGDNNRLLEGAKVKFAREFNENLYPKVDLMASFLRRPEYLDVTGAEGMLITGDETTGLNASMTKYVIGGNTDIFSLNKGVFLGGTFLKLKDDEATKTILVVDSIHPGDKFIKVISSVDTISEDLGVIAFRGGFDLPSIMDMNSLRFDATAEFAMSKLKENSISRDDGSAFLIDGNIGFVPDSGKIFGVNANVKYMMNDENFYNPLAQSPTFIPSRIMNSDKDGRYMRNGVFSGLYSSFDATSHYSPKFSPMAANLQPTEDYNATKYVESYQLAPFSKNSYSTSVLERDELETITKMVDYAVNGALPFGLATPDRKGIMGVLNAGFLKDAIELTGKFSYLEAETDNMNVTEFGGGAKADLGAILDWERPLAVSGSYVTNEFSGDGIKVNVSWTNVGFNYRFHSRFGVQAGWQMSRQEFKEDGRTYEINGNNINPFSNTFYNEDGQFRDFRQMYDREVVLDSNSAMIKDYIEENTVIAEGDTTVPKFSNFLYEDVVTRLIDAKSFRWMLGLEYYLNNHAWLTLNFGKEVTENNYEIEGRVFDKSTDVVYGNVTEDFKHEFAKSLVEASISVEF